MYLFYFVFIDFTCFVVSEDSIVSVESRYVRAGQGKQGGLGWSATGLREVVAEPGRPLLLSSGRRRLASACDVQLVQVLGARAAEEVVGSQVGVRGATTDQVGVLAGDLSSFLLFDFAVLAFWRFTRRFSSSTPALGTAAPVVGMSTCVPSTGPRACSGIAGTAYFVPFTVPRVKGQSLGVPRRRQLKTGTGRMHAR